MRLRHALVAVVLGLLAGAVSEDRVVAAATLLGGCALGWMAREDWEGGA